MRRRTEFRERVLSQIETSDLMEELLKREGVSARRVDLGEKYSIKTSHRGEGRDKQVIKTVNTGPCVILEIVD